MKLFLAHPAKEIFSNHKLTMRALARALNTTPQTIFNWLNSYVTPPAKVDEVFVELALKLVREPEDLSAEEILTHLSAAAIPRKPKKRGGAKRRKTTKNREGTQKQGKQAVEKPGASNGF
ncbi:MAG: hypothetical protein ABSC04_20585 [Syntrophobacteraceae bacterium]